jgi:hypothetical protein
VGWIELLTLTGLKKDFHELQLCGVLDVGKVDIGYIRNDAEEMNL